MTVNELLKRISSEEITEWMAYYKIVKEEQEADIQDSGKETYALGETEAHPGGTGPLSKLLFGEEGD